MGKRLSIGLAVLVPALLWARSAAAQSPASSASSGQEPPLPERQRHDTYRRLKTLGNEALRERRFDDALQLFLTAWTSWDKDGSLACDIGRLHTRRGEHEHANRWLTRCVNLLADASTPEAVQRRRAEVVDLAVARARVTTLHIETEPGASLSIDGTDIGVSPQSEPAFVEPGQHRIEARKGARYAIEVIDGKAGETRRISLALLPPEPRLLEKPQPPASLPVGVPLLQSKPGLPVPGTTPRFPWWLVNLGTTLTVTGMAGGIMLRMAADDAVEEATILRELIIRDNPSGSSCNHNVSHSRCPELDRAEGNYKFYANASTAVFISAGIMAVGTIGFAAYQIDRVTLTPALGGLVGSFQW